MGTPDDTLSDFLNVLNDTSSPTYHDVNYLMSNVFCKDDPQNGTPSVGITDSGPQFIGTLKVSILFSQLFATFPSVALLPLPGAPRLCSPGPYRPRTIGLQLTLTGVQLARWFPHGNPHYSPPLSDIHPDGVHMMNVPACAVFSFDNDGCLMHMAIYLDRFRMMQQLTPAPSLASSTSAARMVSTAQNRRITITIDEA